jgi:hypothetical protein
MTKRHFIIIGVAGFILTLPVLFFGAPFQGDDAITHAGWYIHFSEQFWSGDNYPRWLIGMNGGLGSPVFFYYPPVPYFLTSLLIWLVPTRRVCFGGNDLVRSLFISLAQTVS